jgi:hypothetical protein
MNAPYEIEIDRDHQLELIELLDERLRLRDDPTRRSELQLAHARLREKLNDTPDKLDDGPESTARRQPE